MYAEEDRSRGQGAGVADGGRARGEYASLTACCDQVGRRLGLGKETVRRWAVQADIDAGARPGVSTEQGAEIKRLKAENRRLTEDLEIMRRASIFFAGELDPRRR